MRLDLGQLREAARLTQKEVAAKANRSQAWVSKLEAARVDNVTLGNLRLYLNAVGYWLHLNLDLKD